MQYGVVIRHTSAMSAGQEYSAVNTALNAGLGSSVGVLSATSATAGGPACWAEGGGWLAGA